MVMDTSGIATLCTASEQGALLYRSHVAERGLQRDQPDSNDINYILCYDEGRVLEPYPNDPQGQCALIWGKTMEGRIGHIVCGYPPNLYVITTYWPDLRPDKWLDWEYTMRRTL